MTGPWNRSPVGKLGFESGCTSSLFGAVYVRKTLCIYLKYLFESNMDFSFPNTKQLVCFECPHWAKLRLDLIWTSRHRVTGRALNNVHVREPLTNLGM